MRKQFQSNLQVSPELQRLLDRARTVEMTEEDWWEQRISWAYGNLPHESTATKDDVRRAANQVLGKSSE